jgi:Cu/Ag efflux pump CusA
VTSGSLSIAWLLLAVMLSGTRANIAVKIFGDDLFELRRLGRRVDELIREVPGAVDVAVDQQAEIPFVVVRFDRAALANYGLTMAEASEALETAFNGTTVGRILEGEAGFDLVVRLPEAAKDDFATTRHPSRVPCRLEQLRVVWMSIWHLVLRAFDLAC